MPSTSIRSRTTFKPTKAMGIKLHQTWNPFSIDGKPFRELMAITTAKKLPVFIHLYSRNEAGKLLRFIGENQDMAFIITHLLDMHIFRERRSQLQNVYFDTSGSDRIRPADILDAIRLFGSEHVMFGSDTLFTAIGDRLAKIDAVDLSDGVKERILGQNMKHVGRLGTA
jgi:predicted TIM-barrel fold metal-dependent hydrolase